LRERPYAELSAEGPLFGRTPTGKIDSKRSLAGSASGQGGSMGFKCRVSGSGLGAADDPTRTFRLARLLVRRGLKREPGKVRFPGPDMAFLKHEEYVVP
jgi:hypothetical protein